MPFADALEQGGDAAASDRHHGAARALSGRMMALVFCLAALIGLAMPAVMVAPQASAAPSVPRTEKGVGLTPRNFPQHQVADLEDMFEQAQRVASYGVVVIDWNTPDYLRVVRYMLQSSVDHGLTPVLIFNPLRTEGPSARVEPPGAIVGSAKRPASFADPAVADAFARAVMELADLHPPFLALAADVNLLAAGNAAEFQHFIGLYGRIYDRVKAVSPQTRVFVTFQYDSIKGSVERDAAQLTDQRRIVDAFRPKLDLLAFSAFPSARYQAADMVPADYFSLAGRFRAGGEAVFFTQIGWLGNGRRGETEQAAFIDRLPALLSPVGPSLVAWAMLHDLGGPLASGPLGSLGLRRTGGAAKPAFDAFARLASSRDPAAVRSAAPGDVGQGGKDPHYFGIYTANLDGSMMRPLISDPVREVNHAQLSPDGNWIVFTRYNKKGPDGYATELNGYEETEILLARADGSDIRTLVPPRPGAIAAVASWTPDGSGIVFVAMAPKKRPRITRYDLASGKLSRLPAPSHLATSDPHYVDGKIVFTVIGDGLNALWIMNEDGSEVRQLTRPLRPKSFKSMAPPAGDYDPKLSPDGTHVAFMRHVSQAEWHTIVIDVATGVESDLSRAGAVDAVPEWAPDGRTLIFWSVDRQDLKRSGLYTMRPDGTDRRRIPLPPGYFYTMPTFIGPGPSGLPRIMFSAKKDPLF